MPLSSHSISADQIRAFARECGFELAGVASAQPSPDFPRFEDWRAEGYAGEMTYLTDHRGDLRRDPASLLPGVQSIVCVGKLYNHASASETGDPELQGRIARYAQGNDYHDVMRAALGRLQQRIAELWPEPFGARVCVDTAPLLERSLARQAGLGWIGKNTCLINQGEGSWFFLGELLLTIPIAPDSPPPDRCGTCTRCIDACPTAALIPDAERGGSALDARRCISYLTIEHRGEFPESATGTTGDYLFGCDICQEVCPWNRGTAESDDVAFAWSGERGSLADFAGMSREQFHAKFRHTPISRARYTGFLRNVAAAMGNSGRSELQSPLEQLAQSDDAVVAGTARRALSQLKEAVAGGKK